MSQVRLQLNLQLVYLTGLHSGKLYFLPWPPTWREHAVEKYGDHATNNIGRRPTIVFDTNGTVIRLLC